ncbi:MAG: TrbC/VirB2 family protein [Acidobacteriota bacterium]|nr:TrbC/VirB2 family protein [Acidobacteriota bacterium]
MTIKGRCSVFSEIYGCFAAVIGGVTAINLVKRGAPIFTVLMFMLLMSIPMMAQDPGSSLGTSLQTMFTGPLALGLTIVAIVVGGAMMAFGGHGAMRVLGGVLIGGILILDAVKIATYLQSAI